MAGGVQQCSLERRVHGNLAGICICVGAGSGLSGLLTTKIRGGLLAVATRIGIAIAGARIARALSRVVMGACGLGRLGILYGRFVWLAVRGGAFAGWIDHGGFGNSATR